jgi:hypothetical protein
MVDKSYAVIKDNVIINTVMINDLTEFLKISVKESLDGDDLIEIPEEDLQYINVGDLWDGQKFIAPQPFPSWIWNESSRSWLAPSSKPEINDPEVVPVYEWDELTLSWVEIPELGYLTEEGSEINPLHSPPFPPRS